MSVSETHHSIRIRSPIGFARWPKGIKIVGCNKLKRIAPTLDTLSQSADDFSAVYLEVQEHSGHVVGDALEDVFEDDVFSFIGWMRLAEELGCQSLPNRSRV